MNITREELETRIKESGSPAANLPKLIPQLEATARWYFVRRQEDETAQWIREALLELDETGELHFS